MCAQASVVFPSGIGPPTQSDRSAGAPEPSAQTATYRPWSVSNPLPCTLILAPMAARSAFGSTTRVLVPLAVVTGASAGSTGSWAGASAAPWVVCGGVGGGLRPVPSPTSATAPADGGRCHSGSDSTCPHRFLFSAVPGARLGRSPVPLCRSRQPGARRHEGRPADPRHIRSRAARATSGRRETGISPGGARPAGGAGGSGRGPAGGTRCPARRRPATPPSSPARRSRTGRARSAAPGRPGAAPPGSTLAG